MQTALRFETPENVPVQYQPAGLGSRFVAWCIDQALLWLFMFLIFLGLLAAGVSFDFVFERSPDPAHKDRALWYFIGLMTLIWGLGSIAYFGFCELFFRGQTIGKRNQSIRVIKANGFQLDAGSILVRNIFRAIDHMPPMWLFTILSRLGQRAGDMVAGTIVVFDQAKKLSPMRGALAERKAADAQFRFDLSLLKKLNGTDFLAVERVLERLPKLPFDEQDRLLDVYAHQIAKKLSIEPPSLDQRRLFLEDLFAAELRRQDRNLG